MSRAEFMRQLEAALSRVPKDERVSVLAYYNEYFDEAGEENEQAVLQGLDSPQTIASQIMADVAAKSIGKDSIPTVKKGVSAIWLIILAIFAAPIALPIAIAIAACIFGLVITIATVMFTMLVGVFAILIAGFVCLGSGFVGIFAHPLIGLGAIGLGCVMVGISLLIGILVVFTGRAIFGALAKVLSRALNRKSKGGNRNE